MTRQYSDLCRFWLMFLFLPLADKEGPGEEEEAHNGNVIFQTANTCSEPLRCTTASSRHLPSKIEFRICSSSIPPTPTPLHCAAALWQIKFSYPRSLEQRNSSIMYGLRSEILFSLLFCDLIYACLCGSVALVLQYKDKVPQRDGMKRLFEVISKPRLIQLQTGALNTNVFLPFSIALVFSDAGGNEDMEMASQNPGISAVTAGEDCSGGGGGVVHIRWRKVWFDWRAALGLTAAQVD